MMSDFFHGWRRKFGVVTLLLACVFMGGWVRSGWIADGFWYPTENFGYSVDSLHGVIRLYKGTPVARGLGCSWNSENAWSASFIKSSENGHPLPFNPWEKLDVRRRSDWPGLSFCTANIKNTNTQIEMYVIYYWFVVVPLTLLSVYLLLAKPRTHTKLSISAMKATATP